MCDPAIAESKTCIGFLTLADIISVSIPCKANISAIWVTISIPGFPISSSLPKNGLTNDAPALAANKACNGEKIKVTFVLI